MPESGRESSLSHSPGGTEAATPDSFLQALSRSRLIGRDQLDSILAAQSRSIRGSARLLADRLIELGELTHYQTEKLLNGRWRGLVVGEYHILAPLGRGGMGTVYLAKSLARPAAPPYPLFPLVALKVLPPKRAQEEAKTLLRFRREMELGKHLDHPNITRTLDAGEHNGVHYIAMEYVPGQTIRQLVSQSGPLPVGEAARLFGDVAAGLAHAHERGLIHRDLKPSNIMVTPEGRAKILDLGMALLVDEALPEDPAIVGGEGYILGTMDYIAPEQTSDATNVGPRSDIYSLGCAIYFAVCGMPPFPGGSSIQKMKWHRTEAAPPVNSINPGVPSAFARVIDQFMAKDPNDRPESADAVRARLLPWADEARTLPSITQFTDREVVAEIDSPNFDPVLWEAVPEAELVEPIVDGVPIARQPRLPPHVEGRKLNQPNLSAEKALLYSLAGCALIGALAGLAVVVALIRKL
jgi:serine/threonine protein kinase